MPGTKYMVIFSVVGFVVIASAFLVGKLEYLNSHEVEESAPAPQWWLDQQKNIQPTTLPTGVPVQEVRGVMTTQDNDPIVNCLITPECGGGTKTLKSSECKNVTCCQLNEGWFLYSSREQCSQAQKGSTSKDYTNSNYFPCSIYHPSTNTISNYSYMTLEQCNSAQLTASQETPYYANQTYSSPTPYPTYPTYQGYYYTPPSYTSGNRCYSSWNEWFNAHPSYASQNITGLGPNPPCD